MEPIQILIFVGSLLIGYLLGSINPGYLFGRLKGIDIREVGTKNAGTANVYKSLGLIYAIPTAFYDTLKGLLVVYLTSLIGADLFTAHLSGLFAILGHIFPFYLTRCRLCHGSIIILLIQLHYIKSWHFLLHIFLIVGIFYFIFFLLLLVIIFVYVTRRGNLLSPITLPLLGYYVYITYPDNPYNLFFWIILGQITI
ncbi:MAG: glycerol-3-phosphate acyltransferase [Promethearchaeota archaeon]